MEEEHDPQVNLLPEGDLCLTLSPALNEAKTTLVTTDLLGKARIPGLPYENADGSPLKVDTDYFGKKRGKTHPTPGPFEAPMGTRSVRAFPNPLRGEWTYRPP